MNDVVGGTTFIPAVAVWRRGIPSMVAEAEMSKLVNPTACPPGALTVSTEGCPAVISAGSKL
jgi:hypothetical protein